MFKPRGKKVEILTVSWITELNALIFGREHR